MKEFIELHENPGIIDSPKSIFDKIRKIKIDYSQENFLVFFLNTKATLINAEALFKGGLNSCLVDPKTIFRKALAYNSASIIIAHKHPAGDITPLIEDEKIFENLREIGDLIQLNVIDSIVFNQNEFFSMLDI
jgi:DNA repair protein RadC